MFVTDACIHSLGGEIRKVRIVEKVGDNSYVAEYNGTFCTAIFNPFVGLYYADDKYGILHDYGKEV